MTKAAVMNLVCALLIAPWQPVVRAADEGRWWALKKKEANFQTGEINRTSTTAGSLGSRFTPYKNGTVERAPATKTEVVIRALEKPDKGIAPTQKTNFLTVSLAPSFAPAPLSAAGDSFSYAGHPPSLREQRTTPASQGEVPIAGKTLSLRLSTKSLGCLEGPQGDCRQEVEVETDKDGLATVFFSATARKASGALEVRVKDPDYSDKSKKFEVNVGKVILTKPLKIMLGLAAAASVIGATIIKLTNKDSIQPLPPPVVR